MTLLFFIDKPIEFDEYIERVLEDRELQFEAIPVFADGEALFIQHPAKIILSWEKETFTLFGKESDMETMTPAQWENRIRITSKIQQLFRDHGYELEL